jgi:hypothetical protein
MSEFITFSVSFATSGKIEVRKRDVNRTESGKFWSWSQLRMQFGEDLVHSLRREVFLN